MEFFLLIIRRSYVIDIVKKLLPGPSAPVPRTVSGLELELLEGLELGPKLLEPVDPGPFTGFLNWQ